MAHSKTTTAPLPMAHRSSLRKLIDSKGEKGAIDALGTVSRATLTRALAGLPLRRGTILVIEAALGKLVTT